MTIRSRAALDLLLADNNVGAISAQDMRDVVDSLAVVGPVMLDKFGFQQSFTAGVWTKLAGATTFTDPGNGQFSMPLGNRLENISPEGVTFSIGVFWDWVFEDAANGVPLDLGLYYNGVLRPESVVSHTGGGNNDPLSLTLVDQILFAPGDTLELWGRAGVDDMMDVYRYQLGFTAVIT